MLELFSIFSLIFTISLFFYIIFQKNLSIFLHNFLEVIFYFSLISFFKKNLPNFLEVVFYFFFIIFQNDSFVIKITSFWDFV